MSRRLGRYRQAAILLVFAGALCPSVAGSAQAAAPAPPDAAAAPSIAMNDYRLGPGDKIRLTVYDEAGLTGEYIVSAIGTISVPLIGDFPAGGQTIAGLRTALEERLAKGVLNDPKVAAEIIEYRPFFILGEVNKPGKYPYSVDLTVNSAVATAQGFTYRASKNKVFVMHAGETVERRLEKGDSIRIMPGDTVRVGERTF